MKILRTLQNPFALVAEGFIAVAIIFYATIPAAPEIAGPASTAEASFPQEISEA